MENKIFYPVASECADSYKEIVKFVELCRQNGNEKLIRECITFCDLKIEKISTIREFVAHSSHQKQSCYFTLYLIKSLRDDLNSLNIKEGGRLDNNNVKWLESDSAFSNSIRTGIIKNLKHIEPKNFVDGAGDLFALEIKKTLDESHCNRKVYTVLKALFVREKG